MGFDVISEYAAFSGGTERWFVDFAVAFRKMSQYGYADDGTMLVPAALLPPANSAGGTAAAPSPAVVGGAVGGALAGALALWAAFALGRRRGEEAGRGGAQPLVGAAKYALRSTYSSL